MEIDNNSEEEFSNLVLNNDKMKNVTKLWGKVENFWDDEKRWPKEGCILYMLPRFNLKIGIS